LCIAVVKCLLLRNRDNDLFQIKGNDYFLEDAIRAVLLHYHVDVLSQAWTIDSMRPYFRRHHPEMLMLSDPDARSATALCTDAIPLATEERLVVLEEKVDRLETEKRSLEEQMTGRINHLEALIVQMQARLDGDEHPSKKRKEVEL
jgi:hypothetical protein